MKLIILVVLIISINCDMTFNEYAKDIIEQVNSNPNSTWTAGHNAHWDYFPLKDIKNLMGLKQSPEWMRLPLSKLEPLKDLPTNFDSREQWPKCDSIREVRDQSNCGSCWAFAACEAMSDRLCIASNQTDQTRISTEDLVSCCGYMCGQGCNGGFANGAWRYFTYSGIVTGDLYGDTKWCKPYSMQPCNHHTEGKYKPCSDLPSFPTPNCTNQCAQNSTRNYDSDKRHAKKAYQMTGNDQIMSEIMSFGPVETGFTVYEDFPAYKSGVYSYQTGKSLGGHAVKFIGWGVEKDVPYWIVANSWNDDWGEKGFFRIKRGNNECGIENSVVAGQF